MRKLFTIFMSLYIPDELRMNQSDLNGLNSRLVRARIIGLFIFFFFWGGGGGTQWLCVSGRVHVLESRLHAHLISAFSYEPP